MQGERIVGLVIKSTGSWYSVLPESVVEAGTAMDSEESVIKARMRGALRLRGSRSTNPVVVGDRVVLEMGIKEDDTVIVEILERKNCIVRRSSNLSKESHVLAANVDMVYLMVTFSEPRTSPEFIDRLLVTSQAYNIPATILINKIDLSLPDPQAMQRVEMMEQIYSKIGYTVYRISAQTGQGIEALKEELQGRVSLFTGNSGVGKSTLINALDSSLRLKVGKISSYHHKGMHTTTFSEIFPIQGGGYMIDTPGVKGFGLVGIESQELKDYFPEMLKTSADCQYYNCTHTHEPDCAVMQAVAEGDISESRYESYLKMAEQDNDGKYRK